ncbi:MAG TPA: MotA/TolQ/ExbB proton channel family protein [Pirellulales bacterium]|jgi:biopolymer transport protein ExbB|nr:MotA/TolQ/ExbB proton channel family protein [Pirellulales bacterium]
MVDRLIGALRPWHLGLALALLLATMAVDGLSSQAMAQEGEQQEQGQVAPLEQENALMWIIKTSGAIGAVLLILSIYFVSTVSRMFIELRPSTVAPPEIVTECQEMLAKRQFKEIYTVVKDDPSFYGRVLSTGIAELPGGLAEAREAMERVGEALTVEMEKKISMLAVLGTLGPMIGLLGTLKGMIASFSVIARSDQAIKASEVAGGISEALLLTFEGVALSVPAIYFFAVFRNRVSSLTVSTSVDCDEFLRHFAHAARSKTPAAAPAAAPAAPPKPAKA